MTESQIVTLFAALPCLAICAGWFVGLTVLFRRAPAPVRVPARKHRGGR